MRTKRWHVLQRLAEERGWRSGVEVGVLNGATFFHLLDHCPHLRLIGVDRWEPWPENEQAAKEDMPALFAEVADKARRYGSRAGIIRADSVAAAGRIPDASQDFVFIDADHSFEAVVRDIRAWKPKLRVGGTLCGHDIDQPDVLSAVLHELELFHQLEDDVWLAE